MLKVLIAFIVIGSMEALVKWDDKRTKYCFEIAMSILMGAWIISGGDLLW
ncbi:MAG: hypothetical protein IJQ88_05195 [Clostridia bacterium]|nr:hypothetical protein [Clostridia bacterium]MBQ9401509.1 hypothetical protein [Clostridia bacterium]